MAKLQAKRRIDELYTAHPFYGSCKLTVLLSQDQIAISRPTVQCYMREMGIAGISLVQSGANTLSLLAFTARLFAPASLCLYTALHRNHSVIYADVY